MKLCKLAVNILNNFKLNQQKILAVLKLFKLAENNLNNFNFKFKLNQQTFLEINQIVGDVERQKIFPKYFKTKQKKKR